MASLILRGRGGAFKKFRLMAVADCQLLRKKFSQTPVWSLINPNIGEENRGDVCRRGSAGKDKNLNRDKWKWKKMEEKQAHDFPLGKLILSFNHMASRRLMDFLFVPFWEASPFQNGWIFGKVPNGLWPPPPSFSENHVADLFRNSWPKYPLLWQKSAT